MVKIEEIKIWVKLYGNISHILIQTNSGWNQTACGILTPNGDVHEDRPIKVCRKCRAELPKLTVHDPNN